ncbi:MAG TPA: F0F1 ATP synthase subunit B, partial [Desulfobacterales bacterium]|nr:F0F1 ATP synthase subunit B [Desulfobacterales bacterium]
MRIKNICGVGVKSASLAIAAGLAMAGAAWASEAHGHGGIDAAKLNDLLWRTVNFLIFAAILFKLAAKPLKEFFANRKRDISQELQDLETQKIAVQKALKEAKSQLAAVAAERE